jgi:hypothetical protein
VCVNGIILTIHANIARLLTQQRERPTPARKDNDFETHTHAHTHTHTHTHRPVKYAFDGDARAAQAASAESYCGRHAALELKGDKSATDGLTGHFVGDNLNVCDQPRVAEKGFDLVNVRGQWQAAHIHLPRMLLRATHDGFYNRGTTSSLRQKHWGLHEIGERVLNSPRSRLAYKRVA